eukprot:PhF_6_TR4472/c0_g3_i1/m.6126
MTLSPQQSSTELPIIRICRQRGFTPVIQGPHTITSMTSTSISNTLNGSQQQVPVYVIYFRERPDVTVFVSLRSSLEQTLAVGCLRLIPLMNSQHYTHRHLCSDLSTNDVA